MNINPMGFKTSDIKQNSDYNHILAVGCSRSCKIMRCSKVNYSESQSVNTSGSEISTGVPFPMHVFVVINQPFKNSFMRSHPLLTCGTLMQLQSVKRETATDVAWMRAFTTTWLPCNGADTFLRCIIRISPFRSEPLIIRDGQQSSVTFITRI